MTFILFINMASRYERYLASPSFSAEVFNYFGLLRVFVDLLLELLDLLVFIITLLRFVLVLTFIVGLCVGLLGLCVGLLTGLVITTCVVWV